MVNKAQTDDETMSSRRATEAASINNPSPSFLTAAKRYVCYVRAYQSEKKPSGEALRDWPGMKLKGNLKEFDDVHS